MAEERVNKIIKRWEQRSAEKSQWHNHYEDLARVMLPRRMGFTTTLVEGERRTTEIFDGTPMQAARGLANSIGGMLRPQGIPEIKMKAEDDRLNEIEEAKAWLEDSQERLKAAFNNPKARYRQASGEIDLDLVVFGTGVMFEGESLGNNHLLFQSVHLKDATPSFNEEGVVDGMFRKRMMPIRDLVQRFGAKKLSERVREQIDKQPYKKIDVLHAVIKRDEFKQDAMMSKDLPFADFWIELESKHDLSEGGFHEFPFIVPQWDTSSGEEMGRSPGMIALPDADTLQAMGETILIAGQRAADPPLAVPNDGTFDAINTFPSGLSYYDVETAVAVRGNPFFTIPSGTNLPITRDMQADARAQVFSAFYRNVLNLPVEGPQMTATEVMQRKEEFIREVGPVFGRLETSYTAPKVERAFMIMLRAGAFAPIPEVLMGQNVRFEYDSPVTRIRQQVEASAAKIWAQELIVMAEAKPEALDLINIDELARFSAEALGIPRKIVNSEDSVAQMRQQRLEAAQQVEEDQAIAQAAEVLKTGATAADTAGLIERPEDREAA